MKIAKVTPIMTNGLPVGIRWEFQTQPVTVKEIMFEDIPEGMMAWFLANGVKQKGSDVYAGSKKEAPVGQEVEWAIGQWEGLYEQVLVQGIWARRGGGGGSSLDLLAEAIHRMMEENPATQSPGKDAILESLQAMESEEVEAVKKKWPMVKVVMEEIKAERKRNALKGAEGSDEDLTAMFG